MKTLRRNAGALLVLVALLGGCHWLAALLPGAKHEKCACDSGGDEDDDTKIMDPCDVNGNVDKDGEYLCCHTCSKVCGKRPTKSAESCPKPDRHCRDLVWGSDNYTCKHCGADCVLSPDTSRNPSPIPVPPVCENHCKRVEGCKLGGGDCCAECHQQCPIWREDPNSPGEMWHKDHCTDGNKHWCQNGTEHCCDGCRRICT